jgi:hypothetical protein
MTENTTESSGGIVYNPQDLKTLFEAMQLAPSWMSKRFIMKELCGWNDTAIELNVKLMTEENTQVTKGNRIGGYK